MSEGAKSDSRALAKGGLTNFSGFLLRLGARFPFLMLAARLYGAEELGQFAYATMVAELAAALATIGLKRGLANELARNEMPESHVIADSLLLSMLFGVLAVVVLLAFPTLLFPLGTDDHVDWFPFIVLAIILSDISLTALAFQHNIAATVKARSVIEPWVLTICGVVLAFTPLKGIGLMMAYSISLVAAATASFIPMIRSFGRPRGWRPSIKRMQDIFSRNLPLAGADAAEWATRRLDIFILGRFASAEVVGIYYVAQQVATLAGKIRESFNPILVPMLSVSLRSGDNQTAGANIRQVGFWVLALQIPVVLALSLPGEGVLGLFGPEFAGGVLVLAFLLAAELVTANSSIPELALIFTRPKYNLVIAGAGLVLQGILSVILVSRFGGEGVAFALFLSMLAIATARQALLRSYLGVPIGFWRWSLIWVGAVTFLGGYAARSLPEALQLLVTVPGTLLLFGALIWTFGFTSEDRVLFQRHGKVPPVLETENS